MNRRGFLGAILAAAAGPAIVRASSLMHGRGIIVPTLGEIAQFGGGNHLITCEQVLRESLEILRGTLLFTEEVNREYDMACEKRVIRIAKPSRYVH